MAVYENAEQVQAIYTHLFNTVDKTDPDGMDSLVKAKMVIQFRLRDPQISMWVDGRTKPVQALFADPGVKPTLAVEMSVDTLHEMLMTTLPLGKAVSGGHLKVDGSIFKAFKLQDLFETCQGQYPQIAEEMLGSQVNPN